METNQPTSQKEIKCGEYKFFVKDVMHEKSDGYPLRTKDGNSYSNLVLVVLCENSAVTIFEPIFGKSNLKGIIYAINNAALTFVYESAVSKKEKFELETLIGESGYLLLGTRFYNGNNYPKVECFIKPKVSSIPTLPAYPDLSNLNPQSQILPCLSPLSSESVIEEHSVPKINL